MKIGLIGGSFNPVHLGHLRGAEEAKEILGLNQVIFIPALVSPHKGSYGSIADGFSRLKMISLAIENNPVFEVSDMELKREAPSYTVDTLRYFALSGSENDYYFIMGTELFTRIDTWKDYKKLFHYTNFIILNRPGYYKVDLSNLFPSAIKDEFNYCDKNIGFDVFEHSSTNRLIFINIDGIKISSTRIRELVRNNKSIKYLVPQKVEDYIINNGLYL